MSVVSAEASDIPSGTVVGDYVIDRKIGEGGSATVYLGVHPLIGKKVAIKVLSAQLSVDAAAVERFIYEARSVNQIGHPNIVDIFGFGRLPDGRSYFAMEWLAGETLAARMSRGILPSHEAAGVLLQICDALEAAHHHAIVHRDLKPENVFLVAVRGGRTLVKLLDFGLAKLASDEQQSIRRTNPGMVVGTPAYLAPEQARAQPVDARTDLYSLGVMMFELFAGRLPYDSEVVMDLVQMHLQAPVPSLAAARPGLPSGLGACVEGLLAKDPTARPTLDDVRVALAHLRDETAGRADDTPPNVAGPVTRDSLALVAPRASRWPWLVAGLAALSGVAGLVWLSRPSAPHTQVSAATAAPPVVVATPTPAPAPPPAPLAPAPAPPARLHLRLDTSATVSVDDRVVATGAEVDLHLDPGEHTLAVAAPRRQPHRQVVRLRAGESLELTLALPKIVTSKRATPKATGDVDYMVDPFARK